MASNVITTGGRASSSAGWLVLGRSLEIGGSPTTTWELATLVSLLCACTLLKKCFLLRHGQVTKKCTCTCKFIPEFSFIDLKDNTICSIVSDQDGYHVVKFTIEF